MYEPHLPESFKERLVQAIREGHAEMMEPPEKIRGNRVENQKTGAACEALELVVGRAYWGCQRAV